MIQAQMAMNMRFVPIVTTVFVCCLLLILFNSSLSISNEKILCIEDAQNGNQEDDAVSGKVFTGERVRRFPESSTAFRNSGASGVSQPQISFSRSCEKWSVVTTIFTPSGAVKKQAQLPKDWCMVIVADKKSPERYDVRIINNKEVVFLSIDEQDKFGKFFPEFYKTIPFNSFARKNIGFLYAIAHGAKQIWDFDDDNQLYSVSSVTPPGMTGGHVQALEVPLHDTLFFNPYPLMGCLHTPCWPRGFPLPQIKNKNTYSFNLSDCAPAKIPLGSVGVVQSLANHDPDVDGIYRLTMPLPFDFDPKTKKTIALPKHAYTPGNAQATLIFQKMLWMLYLPFTVHGRVSDIWRAYFAERLAKDVDQRILYSSPLVRQDRNPHSYLADMDSEADLYQRAEVLIKKLDSLQFKANTLPGRLEELYVDMYERNIIQLEDVMSIQGWIKALISMGYQFPVIVH